MTESPQLETLLLPPPLPALLSVTLTVGLAYLGKKWARLYFDRTPNVLEWCVGVVTLLAAIAAVIHGLALAGELRRFPLRLAGWGIAAVGVIAVARTLVRGRALATTVREGFARLPPAARAPVLVGTTIAILLFLGALGPATDADSQEYHLAVPLDLLRSGGFHEHHGWFHYGLTGLGEMLNLLGLAAGTDNLGAVLQVGALLAIARLAARMAKDSTQAALVWLGVMGMPVMVFLTLNQKPQLLGVFSLFVAALLATEAFLAGERPSFRQLAAASLCLFMAVGIKMSFLLPAAPVALLLVVAAGRGRRWQAALALFLGYLVLAFPIQARNALLFGDPLWPMGTRYFRAEAPVVRAFREGLSWNPHPFPSFPLHLFVVTHPGEITEALGVGIVLVLAVSQPEARSRVLFVLAAAAALLDILFAQPAGRFFLDPVVWAITGAGAAALERARRAVRGILLAQGVLTMILAAYGAATLFPGALTAKLRRDVILRYADEAAAMEWLGRTVPEPAVVLSDLRSKLAPRQLRPTDDLAPDDSVALADRIRTERITHYLAYYPKPTLLLSASCRPELVAGPATFAPGVRNPFNRGAHYELVIYRLHPESCDPTR